MEGFSESTPPWLIPQASCRQRWGEEVRTRVVIAPKKPWEAKGEECVQNRSAALDFGLPGAWGREEQANAFPAGQQQLSWQESPLLSGSAQKPLGSECQIQDFQPP